MTQYITGADSAYYKLYVFYRLTMTSLANEILSTPILGKTIFYFIESLGS